MQSSDQRATRYEIKVGHTEHSCYRAQREAPTALTYESADAVFKRVVIVVVVYQSGALLLTCQELVKQANVARLRVRARGRGCIMRAALHNYRVAGKLYDRALGEY